jgi:hypothetical protein
VKRKFFLVLLVLFCLGRGCVFGASAPVNSKDLPCFENIKPISALTTPPQKSTVIQQSSTSISPIPPQPVEFLHCCKFFKLDSQKLFYLTLASVNANRFTINEIQSKSGYVLFTVAQKQFLASVINIDAKNSMLKITPCSNVYYFPIGIVQNMFKYIELNINTPVEKLSVL